MTGKELQKAVVQLAQTLGFTVAHFMSVPVKYPSQPLVWKTPVAADGRGFPDLFMVRERAIAVEIKGDGDSLKPEQEKWLTAMRLAGIEAFVWGPKDWGPDGVIETELKRRARRLPSLEKWPGETETSDPYLWESGT